MTEETTFETWALLEIMGRKRLAGKVSEQTIAGHGFIRIEIPTGNDGFTTQFYGPSSIYAITPTSEELGRQFAIRNQPAPISRFDLPELPERRQPIYDPDDFEERL